MELTPERVYEEFSKNIIDKPSATKLLLSLIENSEREEVRIESIKKLNHIGVKDDEVFKLLENLLISDSNETMRKTAAIVLRNNFIDKALEPVKWAFIHEESPACLATTYSALIEIITNLASRPNPINRDILLSEVKNIKRKEFKLGFEALCDTKKIENVTRKELVELLINFLTIILLEKSYWRLKYKIKNCKIIELDFIFKGLTRLPESLKYLSHLKTLILRYNQLTQIPDWIGTLNCLETLNINVNNLNELPPSIGALSSLRELSLWKNELNYLPNTIGNLVSLDTLNLRLNQLKSLPATIVKLTSLQDLNLHDNQIIHLPESIGNLKSLRYLNLSWNRLKMLPVSLGYLPSLKFLDLERNELSYIPDSIGLLSSLESLNLSDNNLDILPNSIGNLSSLQYLNLSRNDLNSLPKSIEFIKTLQELYLGENNFSSFPKKVRKLEEKGVKVYY
ncbi:MAG: leucine-rich repeat domain-containing protein [Promethearchaeota archaeon]|jgi:Leucine-rich repeat (LRR) protein